MLNQTMETAYTARKTGYGSFCCCIVKDTKQNDTANASSTCLFMEMMIWIKNDQKSFLELSNLLGGQMHLNRLEFRSSF